MKDLLDHIYTEHHKRGSRYGYLFCDGDRAPWIKKWIGTGKKVLDLGCRDGKLTEYFTEGNIVEAVDIDRKALDLAEKKLSIKTHWLDLNSEWPFEPNSFDVVVCCEVLEHLFFPSVILERIKSSLKPGGLFIGSVPNAFRLRNRLKFLWGKEFDNDPTHVRFFSISKLATLLDAHFSDHHIIPIQGKVLPFFPVSPIHPLSLQRLFAKDLLWKAVHNKS